MVWACGENTGILGRGRRALEMKVRGRSNKGRSKRRWLDKVKDDIKEKGLLVEEVYDRATWSRMSSYIDNTQKWESDEEEEVIEFLYGVFLCVQWFESCLVKYM